MNNPSDHEVAVFNAALQLPAGERSAFLEGACGGDDALRRKIEALLQVHDAVGTFLENPTQAVPFLAASPAGPSGTVRVAASLIEQTGQRIGPYKLLQQLGEGGCGVVYMAEQTQPVRRKVALKVIKLGMDTKNVIARFEAERQALALMDHPNIAKVLDAGATETGRPFFVMELVKGVRITDYCDQNNLSTKDRLNLFTQVCHAIQHAHQKGIIHRDIKPSNILVTLHDGVPVPKVIDFGIAKATTDQPLTDKTLFTAFEQFIGTPAYMSPEQAEMTGLDIDTRTDVYALGVLLYELLTGRTPFDPKALVASGIEAMRRTIREQEPERPSTALSTMLAADLTQVASQRQSDAPRLVHLIRGDLDWIVMKALEKDRTRRYETANGLALDVQRYLANELVVARPPSTLYRLHKLARRNRIAFVAAGAVATALVGGLALSTVLFIRERNAHQRAAAAEDAQSRLRREAETAQADEARLRLQAQADEKQANTEATKSRHVARFLEAMLEGVGPSVALGRDTALLREILNKTAVTVEQELKEQPEVQAELQNTVGQIYYELGEYDQAAAMHRQALEKREKLFGSENRDTATSLYNLAYALYRQDNLKEAETLARQSLAVRQKLLGAEDRDLTASLNILANVLNSQGRSSEAETIYRRNLAMQRKLQNDEGTAQALNNLALILRTRGDVAGAESMFREALALYRKALGNERPQLAMALHNLSETLRGEHKLGEAETTSREAWAMRKKLFGGEHPFAGQSLDVTIWVLEDQGRLLEAEFLAREALATARLTATNNSMRLEERLDGLANVQRRLGNHADAETLFRESLMSARRFATNDPIRLEYRAVDLVTVLRPQRKYAEAEALSREALGIARRFATNDPGAVVARTADLSGVLEEEGRMADAESCYRDGIVEQRKLTANDSGLSTMLQNLADLLVRENKAAEGEATAREALAIARLTATNDPARLENNLAALANARRSLGKNAEAEALYREALDSARRFATNDPGKLQFREADLVTVLRPQRKYAEAEALSREALAIARQSATNDPGTLVARTSDLAGVLEEEGRLADAESCYRDSLADQIRLAVNNDSGPSILLQNLADLLVRDGKLAEAEDSYREAVARRRKLSAEGNLDLAGSLHNLGDTLAREGKLAEAETSYREALALRRKLSGADDRDTLGSLYNLSDALAREGKTEESETLKTEATALSRRLWTKNPAAWEKEISAWAAELARERKFDEAGQLFKDVLTPQIEGTPQGLRFRRAEGIFFGRRGMWKRAAADLAEVIAKDPANRDQDHRLASLLAASGDLAGYREQCQRMVVHFGGTNDPLVADRMAKACLMVPSSGADPAVVAAWVETAMTKGTNSGSLPWNQWLKGLAEYRLGRYAAAAEWMPKVLLDKGQPSRDAEAFLVLAMARHKLNQDPEARVALAEAGEITGTKLALPESGDFGEMWFDWIVVQTMMSEARAMIDGAPVIQTSKSNE